MAERENRAWEATKGVAIGGAIIAGILWFIGVLAV